MSIKWLQDQELHSSRPKQISSATLGAEFARVLLSELRLEDLPEPTRHNKIAWIRELHDEVPKRGSIVNFRRMGKQKQDAAKWAFSAQIASGPSDIACKRLFCIIHSEFVPVGCMASEHVYPYAKIHDNQELLLKFLNANEDKEMIDSFLKYPNIKEYLRRDGNRIKGSTYFYKQCYNIMDNLFLMCQGCNSSKSDSDPLEWFKEKENAIYFGEPFIKHIEKQGGLHEGILLPRVYKKNNNNLTVALSVERTIMLPNEAVKSIGLGKVVQDCFFRYYKGVFEIHRDFYSNQFQRLKVSLEKLAPFLVSEDTNESLRAMKKLAKLRKEMKPLAAIEEDIIRRIDLGQQSSSSSETRDIDPLSEEEAPEDFKSGRLAKHVTHRMGSLIKASLFRNIPNPFDGNPNPIYKHIRALRLKEPKLSGKNWENISNGFFSCVNNFDISNLNEKSARDNLVESIKLKISELYDDELKTLDLVTAQKLKEKERELEEKDQKLEAKDREIKEKDQKLEEQNRRIAELERKLALRQKSSADNEQSPPSSESHPFISPVHNEKSAPLSSSSPITSLAEIEMSDESNLKRKAREKEEESEKGPSHSEELSSLSSGSSFISFSNLKKKRKEREKEEEEKEEKSKVIISSPPRKRAPE